MTLAPLWPAVPVGGSLEANGVHVWCALLERSLAELGRLAGLLSDDERQRAERSHNLNVRREFIVSRAVLRSLLGCYLGCDPRHVRFRHGPSGKPDLAEPHPNQRLHFNISHSHGVALFALTRHGPIGVDVEQLRPFPTHLDMAERYFSPSEFHALRGLDPVGRGEAFFHTWTRKEAFLKAHGGGLSYGLERVEVTVCPREPPRILRLDGEESRAASWSLHTLTPVPGYVGALALQAQSARIDCWHLPAG
jgi:4'-phosphopantetheinyl transferase